MRYLLVLVSFLIFVRCENHNDVLRNEMHEPGLQGLIDPNFSYEEAVEVAYDDALNVAPPAPSQDIEQQIIKTGNLRYETQDLDTTLKQVLAAVQTANGYVQNDNAGKDYNQLYHRLTVRVPTQHFNQAVEAISEGVGYFDEKTISRQDVTEEFVDLNARLKAKRALEERYLNLLSKAKNVKEMLEIEGELSKIREEIEAKEGRLKYLKSQVSMSTLSIHFYKITSESAVTQSYGSKIVNALKGGWNGVSVFFLGLLHIWPFILLTVLVVVFTRKWLNKRKK